AFSTSDLENVLSSVVAAASPTMFASVLMLAMGFGLVFVIVYYRRSRMVYAVLALYVIVAMEASPLLQAHEVSAAAALTDAQSQQQAQQQKQQNDQLQLQQQLQGSQW